MEVCVDKKKRRNDGGKFCSMKEVRDKSRKKGRKQKGKDER